MLSEDNLLMRKADRVLEDLKNNLQEFFNKKIKVCKYLIE